MRINCFDDKLVSILNKLDCVPILSTLSNGLILCQKIIFATRYKIKYDKSHYYSYVEKKSTLKSIILLIPIIGNISVAIYDFAHRKSSSTDEMNVEEDTFSPDEDKKPTKNRTVNVPLIIEGDEKNTITINISNYPDLIQGATLEIRNDVDLNLELLKLDARVWGFISEELKNNNNFLNQAILKCSDPGINHQIFLRMGKNARSVNPRMSHPYPD